VHGVPPEVPIEVLVLLEEHNGDLLHGEQGGQHQPGGPTADYAAGGLADLDDLLVLGLLPG
jgi:hypothetical protein